MQSFYLKFSNITIEAKNTLLENLKSFLLISSSLDNYTKKLVQDKKSFHFTPIAQKFKFSKIKPKAKINPLRYAETKDYIHRTVNFQINNAIFVFNMDIFESWIMDLIRIKLLNYPKSFPLNKSEEVFDNKNISVKLIKDATTLDDLWEKIIDEYIYKIGYKDIGKHLELLSKHYNIKIKKNDIFGNINEFSLRRNIIVHNKMIVGKIYMNKAGKFARYKLGDKILLDSNSLFEQTDLLLRFITDFQTEFKK